MPFCPSCGDEYREGFAACAECGETLVAALPDAPPPTPEEGGGSHGGWDQIAEAAEPYQAELLALRLREAGIEAQVLDQSFHQSPAGGRDLALLRILVPVARAADARRVLDEPLELPEDAELVDEEAEGEPHS